MTTLDYAPTDIPTDAIPDTVPDDAPKPPTEPTCRVCGRELDYSGRGRKPTLCKDHKGRRGDGTNTRPAAASIRTSGDVNQALATLQGMYDGLGMALMLLSPAAAAQWTSNAATLQEANRTILTGDKDLTRSINRMGSKGGKAAFAVGHVVAIAPVVLVAQQDIALRAATVQRQRDEAAARAAQQDGTEFPTPDATLF